MSDTEALNSDLDDDNEALIEGEEGINVSAEEAALVTFDFDKPMDSEFGRQLQADAEAKLKEADGSNSIRDVKSGRRDMFSILWPAIKVRPGWNKRRHTEAARKKLVLLAKDIAENGLLEPLRIYFRDGSVFLSDGHRRLSAVRYACEHLGAKIDTVSVIVEPKEVADDDLKLLARQLETDEHKLPKSKFEIAMVYDGMYRQGKTTVELKEIFGKSSQLIGAMIAVVNADPVIHEMIDNGQIAFTFARKQISAFGPEKAVEVLKAAVEVARSKGKATASEKHIPKHFFEEKAVADKAEAEAKKAAKKGKLTAVNTDAEPQSVPEQTDIEEFTSDARTEDAPVPGEQNDETELHEAAPEEQADEHPDFAEKLAAIKSYRNAADLEKKMAEQMALLETQNTVLSGIHKALDPENAEYDQATDDRVTITLDSYLFEHFIRAPLHLKV